MALILLIYCVNPTTFAGASTAQLFQQEPYPTRPYQIVHALPHSTQSFTQGLVVDGDDLIESSGLYSRSNIQRYHKHDGERKQHVALPKNVFAEGVTTINNHLYCLSWRAGTVFVFDKTTLQRLRTLKISGEGWGLATLDEALLMSNGSEHLTLRSPETLEAGRIIKVTRQGKPVQKLNDLSVGMGYIWANIWQSNEIVAIHPDSGNVIFTLDLSELTQQQKVTHADDVLNGIAWDSDLNGLWVTGKRWLLRISATP